MQYLNAKAGMAFTDDLKKKIEEELGEGEYFKREMEKRERNKQRADEHNERIAKLNSEEIKFLKDKCTEILEQTEKMMYEQPEEFYFYFDLDMFFVACELKERPDLADKPVIVGESVVSAANYEARKFGVRSAMPTFVAKRLCPQLIVLPVNMEKYRVVSEIVFDVIQNYDENYVKIGMDEGYFRVYLPEDEPEKSDDEITKYLETLVAQVKTEIFAKTSLTSSFGISFNKMMAKLSSEKNKPNGQFILRQNQALVREFIDNLSIRKIPGIGPCMEQILNGMGIKTVVELRENLWKVLHCFYEKSAVGLIYSSVGYHETDESEPLNPSMSKSETFRATANLAELEQKLIDLCHRLLDNKSMEDKVARNLTVIVKYFDFKMKSKSITCVQGFRSYEEIFPTALNLLTPLIDRPVRLISVKLSKFDDLKFVRTIKDFFRNSCEAREYKEKQIADTCNFVDEDSDIPSAFVTCPICQKSFNFHGNNSALNRHINLCIEKIEAEEDPTSEVKDSASNSVGGSKKKLANRSTKITKRIKR
jgi:DNA polymerase kappa